MRPTCLALAALLAAGALPAAAQTAAQVDAARKPVATAPATAAPAPAAKAAREPTAGQLAARDRQKKCGAEWKDAKAGNRTGGLKWPQFWSKCNARLKGGGQA